MGRGDETFSKRLKVYFNGSKRPIVIGAVVVIGAVIYKKLDDADFMLKASWTTSYPESGSSTEWNSNWDRRNPRSMVKPPASASLQESEDYNTKLKKATPTASRHIFLIRHGQCLHPADGNKIRYLTDLGHIQGKITGHRLKQLDLNYTNLVSSTMLRAEDTAKNINQYLPGLQITYDDLLCEGHPIPPVPSSNANPSRSQERYFKDGARLENAFRKYFYRADVSQKDDSFELIVCHANVIRYFVCRALQIPANAWARFGLAHASITHIVIRPTGNVSLKSYGEYGHMPKKSVSFRNVHPA